MTSNMAKGVPLKAYARIIPSPHDVQPLDGDPLLAPRPKGKKPGGDIDVFDGFHRVVIQYDLHRDGVVEVDPERPPTDGGPRSPWRPGRALSRPPRARLLGPQGAWKEGTNRGVPVPRGARF